MHSLPKPVADAIEKAVDKLLLFVWVHEDRQHPEVLAARAALEAAIAKDQQQQVAAELMAAAASPDPVAYLNQRIAEIQRGAR